MLLDSLLHILFPSLCLSCNTPVEGKKKLCTSCIEELVFLPFEERCRRCFSYMAKGSCARCMKRGSPFKWVASAFEFTGVAASLIHQFKFVGRRELAKDLASWMVIQFLRQNMPLPDLIVPVPQSFARRLSRGYNQSFLIAQEIGELLDRPVKDLLKRKSGEFPQRALTKTARETALSHSFSWKSHCDISDKTILLVDDVMTTGSTLYQCGRVLQEGFPAALYALTFCSAEV